MLNRCVVCNFIFRQPLAARPQPLHSSAAHSPWQLFIGRLQLGAFTTHDDRCGHSNNTFTTAAASARGRRSSSAAAEKRSHLAAYHQSASLATQHLSCRWDWIKWRFTIVSNNSRRSSLAAHILASFNVQSYILFTSLGSEFCS